MGEIICVSDDVRNISRGQSHDIDPVVDPAVLDDAVPTVQDFITLHRHSSFQSGRYLPG